MLYIGTVHSLPGARCPHFKLKKTRQFLSIILCTVIANVLQRVTDTIAFLSPFYPCKNIVYALSYLIVCKLSLNYAFTGRPNIFPMCYSCGRVRNGSKLPMHLTSVDSGGIGSIHFLSLELWLCRTVTGRQASV